MVRRRVQAANGAELLGCGASRPVTCSSALVELVETRTRDPWKHTVR
jgi:hypothetical protein